MKFKFYVIVLLCIMLSACSKEKPKDSNANTNDTGGKQNIEQYEKVNSNGRNPFITVDYDALPKLQSPQESIIAISPDKKVLFIQSRIINKETSDIIMGPLYENVNLIKVNLLNSQRQVIARDIAFISNVKWNKSGSCAAFGGGGKLTLYDLNKDKLLFEKELENDPAAYFGWSPDGKILYTEHPNLPNGSKLYIDEGKIQMAYETDDNLYYKGILDNNYYYGTLRNKEYYNQKYDQTLKEYATVITDSHGNIVEELPEGRYRDGFGLSMLQTNKNGFGLYFIKNINNSDNIKEITNEYVYDAKFIHNGSIVYIVRDKSLEKNIFVMHFLDNGGNEITACEVSGSSFLLLPDGNTGYVGGLKREVVHFDNNTIDALAANDNPDREKEDIFTSIRGAMDTWYKFELTGSRDYEAAKKYLIDTSDPDQWAYFEIVAMMNEEEHGGYLDAGSYKLDIKLNEIKIFKDKKGVQRATASISVNGDNFSGSGFGCCNALELNKADGRWYVTGLSTYPDSKQAERLRKMAQKWVSDAKAGTLFNGVLKSKEIKIGQIQFWEMSSPHLAENVNYANYCKIYLKVMENGKEVVYKMVADKKNQKEWKPKSVSKDRLHELF